MNEKKQVDGIYEELKGLLLSLPEGSSWFDDTGFSARANSVITRVGVLCPEIGDINEYRIKTEYFQGRMNNVIHCIPARASLNSLIGRIRGSYGFDSNTSATGHTFIQNQTVNIELLLEIRGQIERHLPEYATNSPEKKFLEKVKEGLSTTRSAIEAVRLLISAAKDFGISLATLDKIFGN